MEYEVTDRSPVVKELEIRVPADAVSESVESVTKDFARSARLPGFRQGKAPMSLVRSKYSSDIHGEVVDRLMPEWLQKVLGETKMNPVGSPRVIRMDELSSEKPFNFTVAVEVLPEIELAEYTGIEYEKREVEVTEEEIDAELQGLRNRSGVLHPVEGGASEGDIIRVDATISGAEIDDRNMEDHELTIGESPLEELNERAVGVEAGDVIEFEKQWDENAPNPDVAGKLIDYRFEVKEVKKLELPEIDDELAKTVGYDTLDDLRAEIREKLTAHKQREVDNAIRNEISDGLVARHDLEVPSALVEEETNRSMQEYARYLASQGVDPRYAEIDWERVQGELSVEAEKRVKRTLILDAIAREEKLEVSDEELEEKVMEQAGDEGPEVLARLKAGNEIEGLRTTFLRDKAMELVRDAAKPS